MPNLKKWWRHPILRNKKSLAFLVIGIVCLIFFRMILGITLGMAMCISIIIAPILQLIVLHRYAIMRLFLRDKPAQKLVSGEIILPSDVIQPDEVIPEEEVEARKFITGFDLANASPDDMKKFMHSVDIVLLGLEEEHRQKFLEETAQGYDKVIAALKSERF